MKKARCRRVRVDAPVSGGVCGGANHRDKEVPQEEEEVWGAER